MKRKHRPCENILFIPKNILLAVSTVKYNDIMSSFFTFYTFVFLIVGQLTSLLGDFFLKSQEFGQPYYKIMTENR